MTQFTLVIKSEYDKRLFFIINCRNISEYLHWTQRVFGVSIPVCLYVTLYHSEKLSDLLEI